MTQLQLKELEGMRAIDITAGQLATLLAAKLSTKTIELEYVDKETRNKILYTKKDGAASLILKWGDSNGYKVRKSGRFFWNKKDLENLSSAYHESKR